MTKKQLMALMQIIKGVNTLRSDFSDRLFVKSEIRKDDENISNRLVIEAPFDTNAWVLSLFIDDNSMIHCEIDNNKITFD